MANRLAFRPRPVVSAVMSLLLVAASAITAAIVTVPTAAVAVTGSDFDAGYIISDALFYDGDSMSEGEIQAFLNSKVSACRAGYTCLKDFRMTTSSKSADPMCTGYQGAVNESAARIISKVGLACGISPKVLLVMLQKEQSLVTDTWPSQYQYRAAMGAGCPDTAGCDPDQAGFFQQVYFAAWYLIRYGAPPGTGTGTPYTSAFNAYSDFDTYKPGKNWAIRFNPNPDCGSNTVFIRNQPTASLYTYTPYTPNQAALNNLGSVGDGCSSYGNRNFWWYYTNWFGSTTTGLAGVTVDRIGGADRFEVAVSISKQSYPDPAAVPVVYIVTGTNFPDALSAAPAATVQGGPLLLVTPTEIPASVRTEVQRLHPQKIVVVGGENSVGPDVFADLETLAPSVERLPGADRYEVSRNLVAYAFSNAPSIYIATGGNFPDALSASGAGGMRGMPVLLVDGAATEIDQPTSDLLTNIGTTTIVVVGGPNSVSEPLLASLGPNATRINGTDRMDASRNIADAAFGTAKPARVFIATGFNFPDALAGAALAGKLSTPLLVVPGWCVPKATTDLIKRWGSTRVTLLGGPATLGSGVEYFSPC